MKVSAQTVTFPPYRPRARGAPVPIPARPAPKKWLGPDEVSRLIAQIRIGRYCGDKKYKSIRDRALIYTCYRHGLRLNELITLTWGDIDLPGATIHIHRDKNGASGDHPLYSAELRALSALHRLDPYGHNPAMSVFRRTPTCPVHLSSQSVHVLITNLSRLAGLPYDAHPHMLRHGCGYYLCNIARADIRVVQAWLGHKGIQHTVKYTELDPSRFRRLWPNK